MTNTAIATAVTTAETTAHFAQILALQHQYHASTLSADQQQTEGFVFAQHTLPLLKQMAAELPQAIALHDEKVVAYCLAMPQSMRDAIPGLTPMFDQFLRCQYLGQPLSAYRFVVGGQVCVDRQFRGQNLLQRLYHQIRDSLPPDYRLCITEIAVRNQVSIRAHEKMGFEVIDRYADAQEEWVIVAWDLHRREE